MLRLRARLGSTFLLAMALAVAGPLSGCGPADSQSKPEAGSEDLLELALFGPRDAKRPTLTASFSGASGGSNNSIIRDSSGNIRAVELKDRFIDADTLAVKVDGKAAAFTLNGTRVEFGQAQRHSAFIQATYNQEKKVQICHIPPGNPANAHTIIIGRAAFRAHVRNHGDPIGPCTPGTAQPTPAGEPTPVPQPTVPPTNPPGGPGGQPTPAPTLAPEPTPPGAGGQPTPIPGGQPTPVPTMIPEPTPPGAGGQPTPIPGGQPTPVPTMIPEPTPPGAGDPQPTAAPTPSSTPVPTIPPEPTPPGEPDPGASPTPIPTMVPGPTPVPTIPPEPTPGPTSEPTPLPTPAPGAEPAFSLVGFDGAAGANSVYLIWFTPSVPSTSMIQFGETPQLGNETAADTSLVTDHSVTVGGLQPDTTYYFRAVSVDADGRVSFSPMLSKTTHP